MDNKMPLKQLALWGRGFEHSYPVYQRGSVVRRCDVHGRAVRGAGQCPVRGLFGWNYCDQDE